MDDQRFDDLSRGTAGITSRRLLLRFVARGATAALLVRLGLDDTATRAKPACRLVNRPCHRRQRCCRGSRCRHGRCRCRAGTTACDDGRCRTGATSEICIVGCCRPNNAPCTDVCQPNAACAACCFGLCDGVGTCQIA